MDKLRHIASKPFWGWYIVLGAFMILAINYGSRYCFGIFVKPMATDFQWSRSVISIGASLMILFYGIGGIISGQLLDRMAPRRIIALGATLSAAGLIGTSFVTAPWQFFLCFIVFGSGASFFGMVVCSSSIGKWFVRQKGMAIGIASAGIGVGTLILAPLSGYVVQDFGWRTGFLFLGGLIFLIGMLFSQLLMGKTRPEDYGLRPDGVAQYREPSGDGLAGEADDPESLSLAVLLSDSRFWVLAVCYSIAVMAQLAAFVHQVPYAQDNHIGRVAAATSLGIIGVASIGGRFFFGFLGDRISDAKYAASLGFLLMAAGLYTLMGVDRAGILYLYALLFGFGYGSLATMIPFLLADRFGRHILGKSYGMMTFFVAGLGGSVGPIFSGMIYDRFGSYDPAWRMLFILLLLVSLLILFLKPRNATVRKFK